MEAMVTGVEEASSDLSVEDIQANLSTEVWGQSLVLLARTESTNVEARNLAKSGAPEGTVVVADYQTAGRGRLGRRWEAPPGTSILASLVFCPDLEPHQAQRLTMICGLAAVDAIERVTGLDAKLKWPNDLLLGRGKVGGILTDLELEDDGVDFAIVGMGLNVNLRPEQISSPLVPATSLSHQLGRTVARVPLLCRFLESVESYYVALCSGYVPHQAWSAALTTLGQRVRVRLSDSEIVGIAEGVDDNGALLVRRDNGQLRAVWAGDVTLRD